MFPDMNQRTALDLNFSIFRVPVRVHPMHWVTSAFLGWDLFQVLGPAFLFVWIACVFVSVLLHELGHVFAGWYFGSKGSILLTSFGGLALGSTDLSRRWKRVIVLLAGPSIQLVFWAILWLGVPEATVWLAGRSIYLAYAYGFLLQINLWWALFNLLPIYPLDGGRISREVLKGARPRDGTLISLVISAVLAGLFAVEAFLVASGQPGLPFLSWLPFGHSHLAGLFFLMFLVANLQEIQLVRQRGRSYDDRFPWE